MKRQATELFASTALLRPNIAVPSSVDMCHAPFFEWQKHCPACLQTGMSLISQGWGSQPSSDHQADAPCCCPSGRQSRKNRGMQCHLVIIVMQSALEQDLNTRPQLLHKSTKLGQAADSCCPDSGVLQDDAVIDVADVLGRLLGARPLHAQQVQHLRGQICELAILWPVPCQSLRVSALSCAGM